MWSRWYIIFTVVGLLLISPTVLAGYEDEPHVTIVSPVDGEEIVAFKYDVVVEYQNVDMVWLRVNDEDWMEYATNPNESRITFGDVPLPKGDVKLEAVGSPQGSGDSVSHVITVHVKYAKITKYPSTAFPGETYTVNGKVCKSDRAILYEDGKEVARDDSPSEGSCSDVSFDYTPESVGQHSLELKGEYCWGALVGGVCLGFWRTADTDSVTVYVNGPPSVSVTAPAEVDIEDTINISFYAQDDDPNDGIQKAELWVKGPYDSNYTKVATKYDSIIGDGIFSDSFTYKPKAYGDYSFKVVAYDLYGQSGEDTATTKVKQTFSFKVSSDKSVVETGSTVRVYATVSGDRPDNDEIIFYITYPDGRMEDATVSATCQSGSFGLTCSASKVYTLPSEGKYVFQALAYFDGDLVSSNNTVEVTALTPSVEIRGFSPSDPEEGDTVKVSVRACNLDTIKLYVKGPGSSDYALEDSYSTASEGCYTTDALSFTPAESGTYYVKVVGTQDEYGFEETDTDSIYVKSAPVPPPPTENQPPEIKSITCDPSCTVNWGDFVDVIVRADDPDGLDDLDDASVRMVDGDCSNGTVYQVKIAEFNADGYAKVTLRTDWTDGWQQGTRIPPGTYTLCVKAYDDSGDYDEASKTLTILEQYVPPSVSVEVPYENYRVGWAVHIEARATGTDLELLEANVYRGWDDPVFVRRFFEECSGNSCELNANFVPMIAGHYTVVARVVDSNGAEATAEDSFNVLPSPPRNQEPVAKIYTPKKASPGRTFQFTVCGSDSDGEVVTVAGKVGSGDWVYKTPNSKGCAEFSGTAPSSPTTVTVYGKAKDDDGAWSSVVSKTIEVNYSAPVVEAMNVPPKVFVGRDFNISVIVSDVDRDLDRVVLEIVKSGITVGRYSKPVDEDGGTVVFTVSVSEDGNYTAFVTAYDRQGLKASRSENFEAVFPPNEPPVVDSVEILGDVYVGEPFDMNVCAHDPDDEVQWISYRIEGGSQGLQRVWRNGCHIIHVPSPGDDLGPGTYEMNVWAIDYRAANSEPYRTTITVKERDTVPPTVDILDVRDANVPGVIRVDFKAQDNYELNAATVFYKREGGDWKQGETYPMSGKEYEVDAGIPVFEPGEYNIMIVVTDTSGNKATAYTSARAVDEIPPMVTITAPDEVDQGEEFTFDVSVTDNYKIRSVSVKVDGKTIYEVENVDANYWSRDFTYAFPHASSHRIEVVAEDYFNNEETESHSIEVHEIDTNAPVVDLNAEYNAETHRISWTVYASDPNLAEVNVYVNGEYMGSCDVDNGTAECVGEFLVETPGNYVVTAVAVDIYGNESEDSVTVYVGDNSPELTVSAPATVPVGGTATIYVFASDDFGLRHIEINGYGLGVDEDIGGTTFEHEFNVVFPEEGNYVYSVSVTDTNGHVVSDSVTITATREGHVYELVATKEDGKTGYVWFQGKIDGEPVDITCDDIVYSVKRTDGGSAVGSFDAETVEREGHSTCQITITGAGRYRVRGQWMGDEAVVYLRVYGRVSSAPENVLVALVVGILALVVLGRFM